MENNRQNWYESWAVWLSLVSLICYILKKAFNIDLYGVWNDIADYVLTLLIAFGIVNNPNTSNRLVLPNIRKPIIVDLAREDKPDADE